MAVIRGPFMAEVQATRNNLPLLTDLVEMKCTVTEALFSEFVEA